MTSHVRVGTEVRQAGPADFDVALPLVQRFFDEEGFHAPPAQIPRQLLRLLQDADSAVFLAWWQGQAVGLATVTTTEGIELGLSAELEDLYVLPKARRLGVGQSLIEAVAAWCRARGCSLVSVIVTPEGQAAHDLTRYYRDRGFMETGRTVLFLHLHWETREENSVTSVGKAPGREAAAAKSTLV
jgi:aminoglycoside 6'-N-acetyltransferase I